jgi:hypothetical protein
MTMGALVAVLLAAMGPAIAAPCPASAALEGPAGITTSIARGLRAHGVAIGTSGACPGRTVRAVLTSAAPDKGYKLHIEDSFGRTSDRVIAESDTAVSLIESWVVDEDADLLTVASTPTAEPATVAVAAAAPAAMAAPLRFYGGVASLVGSDQSISAGAVVGACGHVGRACVGGELDGARDLGLVGDTADAGTTRTSAGALVTAGLPLSRGRFLLMPAVGAGVGWMRTHLAAENAMTPAETASTWGMRAKLSVLTGVSVSSHFMVALELAGLFAPGARANPADDSSSSTSTSTFPPEPKASLRVGLACVVTP